MQCHSINTDPMAAERFLKDVLFFTVPSRRKIFLTHSNRQKNFFLDGSNKIGGMATCVENAYANNRQQIPFFRFAERNEKKFVDVVKKEAQSIGKIKVEFAISMNFGENVGKE